MRLVVRIMETASVASDSPGAQTTVEQFKEDVVALGPAVAALEAQIRTLKGRLAVSEGSNLLTDAMPFRCSRAAAWASASASARRLTEFVGLVLERGTVKTDLESRQLWLQPAAAAALGLGTEAMSFYDLLRGLPRWFVL